jgi:hypothetical protein
MHRIICPRPCLARHAMILRISAGSRMTAITSILLPHLGQTKTSSSYTLASNRAQAFLLEVVLTGRCSGPPWGRSFQVPHARASRRLLRNRNFARSDRAAGLGKNTIRIDAPDGAHAAGLPSRLPLRAELRDCRPMDVEGELGDEVQGREVLLPGAHVRAAVTLLGARAANRPAFPRDILSAR